MSARVLLLVVLAVVLGVSAGVAHHVSVAAAGSTPDFNAGVAKESPAVQARANAVFESFNGTQAQRNASGVVQAWKLNGAMDECMDRHGFPEWDWSSVRNQAPRTNALGTSVWLKNPAGAAYSSAMADIGGALLAEESARVDEPPAAQQPAIDVCLREAPEGSDSAADDAATPAGVAKLREEWWSTTAALDANFGDPKAYNACFAVALPPRGVDALVTGETWQEVLARQLPPAADVRDGAAGRPSESWAAFVATEARLEAADWACRAGVYNAHLDDLDIAVEAFAEANGDEIERARDAWVKVETRARDLGFDALSGVVAEDAR